jgi:hypothetical protein
MQLIAKKQWESNVNTFALSLDVMNVLDEARKQLGVIYPNDKTH